MNPIFMSAGEFCKLSHSFRGSLNCRDILPLVFESPHIHLGTSAFTASGWQGSFYPVGLKPADYLTFYAEHFDSVEIDSTFYAIPSEMTVKNWANKTPDGFIVCAKVPQVVTHEKVLRDCDVEFDQFIHAMDILGPKLGVLCFQFPFFSGSVFKREQAFLDRLTPFLQRLPADHKFAVEIRNRKWLNVQLADVLRSHGIALVLQDRSWMPHPDELAERFDPITADFTYIRWLGDRKGIEAMTQTWDKTVIDRTNELSSWVDFCYQTKRRGVTVYAFANNHYSGHSPATIDLFCDLWNAKGPPQLKRQRRTKQQASLFS
jgi:uncharacterized protein YecE (DUF72 family)